VDNTLLGQFVVAAFDGCTSSQDALLTLMVKTRHTAPLVELARAPAPTWPFADDRQLTDERASGHAGSEFR
jgi:hypothetical protein